MSKTNSKCPRCGKEFRCRIKDGKSTCWCFSHPPLEKDEVIDNYSDECLCEDCLTGTTQGKVRAFFKTFMDR